MLIYHKDKSIPESVKREREICASVVITPQSAKIVGTVEQVLRWDGESVQCVHRGREQEMCSSDTECSTRKC